jgi:D-alanine-D-alanine ligase-like ATP-grasp enzyme
VIRRLKAALYRKISERFMAGCSNYNTLEVRRASRSKEQAREVFARHGFPHARGAIFTNPFSAQGFAREHGFPLVVKPNVSGFSRGSHFPINSSAELWKASLAVKVWWPTSVVEQYLLGANYRVLATQDKLVSVIRRYPPFVDGDGIHNIAHLIDAENATRASMGLHPTIYPIEISASTRRYLAKQGLTLDSVPADGERVHTFNRVALAPGGIVETIDRNTIPAANQQLFLDVMRAFDARLLGIDVIFEKGIETDWREQQCILLEVNSRPYTRMHDFPRYGNAEDLTAFKAEMDALVVDDTDTF